MRHSCDLACSLAKQALSQLSYICQLARVGRPSDSWFVDLRESGGDGSVDTVEVWGSSPHGPTIQNKELGRIPKKHDFFSFPFFS